MVSDNFSLRVWSVYYGISLLIILKADDDDEYEDDEPTMRPWKLGEDLSNFLKKNITSSLRGGLSL